MLKKAIRDLESEIRQIDGVLGVVAFPDASGSPVELQVFVKSGTDQSLIRKRIASLLGDQGLMQSTERVYIFELAGVMPHVAEIGHPNVQGLANTRDIPGPSEPLEIDDPIAEPAERALRPRIGQISLASGGSTAEAQVSLVLNGTEAQGLGRARKTTYSLRVTAAATLEAAQALIGQPGLLALEGAGLVDALNRRMVVVLVHSALFGGRLVLGAALVGDSPVHEATVRATLDAVNRQLESAVSI